jgi:WD40 repeat protein
VGRYERRPPLQTFRHGESVSSAKFSRDESRILTQGGGDHTAKLWDVTRAEPLRVFQHDEWIWGAVFSADESDVLTWSKDQTVKLWDIALPDDGLTPDDRILEFEIRSSTLLDESGEVRALGLGEWLKKKSEFDRVRARSQR